MKTLVVSDLHLGARSENDVLRWAEPLAALREALAGVGRLVLLGDVLELRQGPRRLALAAAEAPLAAIGEALEPGAEVVLVPGNHDHLLLAPWLERRARDGVPPPLGLESSVDRRAGEPLAKLARWLAPAEVHVRYPGYWVRPDVYATHGHYADLHTTVPMLERLGAGAMTRLGRRGSGAGPASAEDYEAILAPIYAWIDAVAQTGGVDGPSRTHGASARAWRAMAGDGGRDRDLAGGLRGLSATARRGAVAIGFPALIAALNRAGLGPLSADLSGEALRRAGLAAIGEATGRLGVDSSHVLFGHTHRAGPLPSDDRAEWVTPSGAQLINTGCWVHAPSFLGPDPLRSPYRAGFCVTVEDDGPPVLSNLLQ